MARMTKAQLADFAADAIALSKEHADRADATEAKLTAIEEHCCRRLDAAIVQGPVSRLCRDILAIIGSEEALA